MPKSLDPRDARIISEDHKRADEFALAGSVKHFALRLGFMPFDEREAETLLTQAVRDQERYQDLVKHFQDQ